VQLTTPTQLSIIIPTLNEATSLPLILNDLQKQKGISFEIIIGDGGSTDATRAIAGSHGARFAAAARGRGAQMNAATALAAGELLLFLHADSRIKDSTLLLSALQALTSEDSWQDAVAGHFSLRFIRTTSQNSTGFRFAEEKSALNRPNTTNGDQGLLISRQFFNQLGGFDTTLPFLEDQRIAEKIRSTGRWITLPGCLETSARRFEAEGFHRRYILMSMMMGLYSVGEEIFFQRAPEVYRAQQDTGRLFLAPFFKLIFRLMRYDWGFYGSILVFYRLGRYIRQNSWQMFFFIDVCLRPLLGKSRYPFLNFHDRFFAPCTNFKPFNALAGVLCFFWFICVLAPLFMLLNRCSSGVTSAVALFVRRPLPGLVKTRLALEIGDEQACSFYRSMVLDALNAGVGSGAALNLFHDGVDEDELPSEWLKGVNGTFAQHGDSIGDKMAAAFKLLFSIGIQRVALFGSDIPGVDAELLKSALFALERYDVAIVPAVDGGYCVIAINNRKFTERIFKDIEWSSENVLSSTMKRCRECGLRVKLLESCSDIDTLEDLLAYCQKPSKTAVASNVWLREGGYLGTDNK